MLLNSRETELLCKLSRTKVKSCLLLLEFYRPTNDSHMLKAKLKKKGLLLKNRLLCKNSGFLFVFF